jgi:hypothetical protein
MGDVMEIAYVAYTLACTFLLDVRGVCVHVSSADEAVAPGVDAATRWVGAQYVASLEEAGRRSLVELPRLGCPMLFARVGDDGHISLLRTGPLVGFANCDEVEAAPLDATLAERDRITVDGATHPGWVRPDVDEPTWRRAAARHRSSTESNLGFSEEPRRCDYPSCSQR